MKNIDLPEHFLIRMKKLLGEEYPAYQKSFEEKRLYGLRVNTLKVSPPDYEKSSCLPLSPIPWISNGYYYQEDNHPAKDPYYHAGLYYLQEPSAMTPASLLPIAPGDKVLDLCAAPGGKSTELGVRLMRTGLLAANDISNSRAKALLKNLELWGIPNICVTSEEPRRLADLYGVYFDKILIDAPCSGEGMFRKDPDMLKSYAEHGPEYFAEIQKEIVTQAARMLKPGGMLLYSTCTFSVCENEAVIRYLLTVREDMELVELPLFDGAADGYGLHGCIRMYPHRLKGEGHFMALLRKNTQHGQVSDQEQTNSMTRTMPEYQIPNDLRQFLSNISWNFDPRRMIEKNGMVYYLPEGFDQSLKLRYLRTGLLLGERKNGRFEPGQALAMALKPEEFKTVVSWPRSDERVIRYLKGETISLHSSEVPVTGWCLVCVDDYPLGFAKGTGMMLKNKYYRGWRWQ